MQRRLRNASNSRDLRILNWQLVRNIIRKHGPLSRRDIVALTGLTPPTVTVIVSDLIKTGLVREIGHGKSRGGRRPIMLELCPRAGFLFVVRIQRGDAVTAIIDLGGTIIGERTLALDTSDPKEVVDAIGESLDLLARELSISLDRVVYCGVASPGLIAHERGVVERSSNLAWEGVPLSSMLSTRLGGVPVQVENISNAAAFGEKVYGTGLDCDNMLYLNLSVGIGAGIILDGEIYRGARGYAGEVGHMALSPEGGPVCTCGRNGCFEATCGTRAVMHRIAARVTPERMAKFGLNPVKCTLMELVRTPLLLDPEVQAVLEEAGKHTGVVIANLVNMFNVEKVILGGELARTGDTFLETAKRVVKQRVLSEIEQCVRVVRSTMQEDPPLMGAYALALERVFAMETWPLAKGNASTGEA